MGCAVWPDAERDYEVYTVTMWTNHERREGGFTVIELLIATVVFTTVLMLITTGVIHFSNQYYKAVHANATQNLVRTISEDITQSLQFSGGEVNLPNPPPGATDLTTLCVGTKKYWYKLGVQHTGAAATRGIPGLYVTPWSARDSTCQNTDNPLPAGGKQLLQKGMRITQFSVTEMDNHYDVILRIAYGDSDLLCSPTADNCDTGFIADGPIAANGSDIRCRSTTGSQFCAVSNINATVVSRVTKP